MKKITKQLERAEDFSEDEIVLDRALLKGTLSDEEGDPFDIINAVDPDTTNERRNSSPGDTTTTSKPGDPTDIFTDQVVVNYPNVTPLQRAEIATGIHQAIAGLFKYHKDNRKSEDDKEITKETVFEYLANLKKDGDKLFPKKE